MRAVLPSFLAMIAGAFVLAACIGPSGTSLPGEVVPSGAHDFAVYCAACHGAHGKGAGAVASVLDAPPADLTQLAASNGGEFPMARVMSKIWGYTQKPHDGADIMPRFADLLEGERMVLVDTGDGIETPTPLRLAQLAEHVKGLQE